MRLHQHQFFLGNFQMLNHQRNYFGMVFFSSFPQVTNGGQMRVIWGGSKLHRDDRHSQWLTGEVKVGRLWKIFPRPNHHVGGWGKRAGSDTPDDQILSSDKKDVKTNIKCHSTSTSRKTVPGFVTKLCSALKIIEDYDDGVNNSPNGEDYDEDNLMDNFLVFGHFTVNCVN